MSAQVDPELFRGPLLEDVAAAAGVSVSMGFVGGFVLGGVLDLVRGADPLRVATYCSALAGVFFVAVILWERVVS